MPTLRLATLVALASLGVLASPAPAATLVVVNLVLLGAAALDWTVAVRPGEVGLQRDLPGVVTLGSPATVSWRLDNPRRRRLRVTLADEMVSSLCPAVRRVRLVLRGGGQAAGSTTIHPSRRGRFRPATIVLRVEGPLGLAARQGTRAVAGVIRVYPPFRSRAEAELRIERARVLDVGLRSARGRGSGTEFDSLREYSVDDEFRRIDWAATARTGRTIVRTYRAERNQSVVVLLDGGRTMAGRVEDFPRLDHAMDAVMTVTAVATRLGDRVGLVAFDRQLRAVVPASSARSQLQRVTEAMYELEPRLVESDYRGAFAATLARFRRRSLLIVLTDLAEEAAAETLLPVIPLMASRHLVMVGSVVDPQVVAWAREVPDDAGSAYRKAAAVSALAERARTAARLRGLGVIVIDAEPGRLAPLLADAYLDIKSRGVL